MGNVAAYTLEIAMTGRLTGLFTVGTSVVGGPDVVGGFFGSNVFDDVSAMLREASIKRGRSSDFANQEQGTMTVVLKDPTGRFNVENAGTLTNLVTNPSFETDAIGALPSEWVKSLIGGIFDFTAESIWGAKYGSKAAVFAATLADEPMAYYVLPDNIDLSLPYVVSVWLKVDTYVAGGFSIALQRHDTGAVLAQQAVTMVEGDWLRYSVIYAGGGAGSVQGRVRLLGTTGGPNNTFLIVVDAVQVEQAVAASDYVDGSVDDCRWAGTAHASQSYRGGPYYGLLREMRPIRFRGTSDGGLVGNLFYGYIWSIEHEPGLESQQSYIEAVDLFDWLSRVKPTITTLTNQTVSFLIGRILNAAQFTDLSARDLEAGGITVPSFSADGTKSCLQLIADLLLADQGLVYMDGAGRAVYRTRGSRWSKGTSVATWTATDVGRLRVGVFADQSINKQSVLRTGGVAQVANDTASQQLVGIRQASNIESTYFPNDSVAGNLADFIVFTRKDGITPARNMTRHNWTQAALEDELQRELNDLITINESVGGTNFQGRIRRVQHDIVNGGKHHEVQYTVEKLKYNWFTVGTSVVDGPDPVGF